jgi:GDPmannose 4,6-dehydratase
MASTALITGITGQDGAYLAQHLLDLGYRVVGGMRCATGSSLERLERLDIVDDVELVELDLADQHAIRRVLEHVQPHEVYNLAALSNVAASFDQPVQTGDITALGAVRLLEAVRDVVPHARLYQASSSELYGAATTSPQHERTPFAPRSPYAAAKLHAHHACAIARDAYGMHVSCGILFNHESPLRGPQFVTRKVTMAAARIRLGLQRELRMGNLDARRDWGYAREYVAAMHLMVQQDEPGDYVVATGTSHSVGDLVASAFAAVDLDWRDHVVVDTQLLRPLDQAEVVGDPSKAAERLGWRARTGFAELVELMVEADLELAERELGRRAGTIRVHGDIVAATEVDDPERELLGAWSQLQR